MAGPRRTIVAALVAAGAVLAGVTIARTQAPARPSIRGIDWAGRGTWLRAELHTHTRFSDGNQTVDDLLAVAAKNRCDVVAITDHTDAELTAATPEYVAAIQAARTKYPALTVVTGIEWNVPPGKGNEHAVVLFPTEMESVQTLAPFKDQFDDFNKKGENPELALAGLASLAPKTRGAVAPTVFINHPSRRPKSTSAPVLTYERLHRAAPDVMVGIEGAPGHQRTDPLGSYPPNTLVDRWDPLVAEVGGAWDQWLGKGLDVWGASATADFHGPSGEFWPCEFSSTWIYAPDRTVNGILRALKAGSYFGEHGHIAEKVELSATAAGLARPALAGERLTVSPGAQVTVSLTMEVPARDYRLSANRIDTVELIGIAPDGKATVLHAGPPGATQAFSVPVTVPAGGIVVRARGRRTLRLGGALMFYTNPIRIATSAR
jgi:hypothetical protein